VEKIHLDAGIQCSIESRADTWHR